MKFKFFVILCFFVNQVLLGQKSWDSTYYKKYTNRLIVSMFQSYRNYSMEISQKLIKDSLGVSKIGYMAEANLISGIEVNYDKISFAIGFKSAPPKNQLQKGDTKYTNLALNFGGNKWAIENSYRSYKGFYNSKTNNYDTSFARTGIYTQLPNLRSEAYKSKFLFFTNANKFSFKSGYSCNCRQLKSAFSFVLSANVYYNRLNSDSSFIPLPVREYYERHQTINGLNVFAFSVYGGGSFNLVIWKALFVNMTLIIGPEQQWRTYRYLDSPSSDLFYTSLSGDFRGSIGLNFKKFFVLFSSTSDFSWYNNNAMEYLSKYYAFNFSLGFRLYVKKTPKLYQKFQQSNIYKKF